MPAKSRQHRMPVQRTEEREYILAELPYGKIKAVFPLPVADLEPHAVEAHFANGLLIVTGSTRALDAYLREKQGEQGRGEAFSP